jgi:hypothetical protein
VRFLSTIRRRKSATGSIPQFLLAAHQKRKFSALLDVGQECIASLLGKGLEVTH